MILSIYSVTAQYIQYRDKKKPAENKNNSTPHVPIDTVAVTEDSGKAFKSQAAITMNSRPKKPYVEEQNMCNLMSRPGVAPQLLLTINEMVKMLKERYTGRLYGIPD